MVYFVGAGCGAPDLITVRGARLLGQADVIIYAGSLVNPELLEWKKAGCVVYNSAEMTLEEVLQVMKEAEGRCLHTVRLHTGDPCLYGAIREQMDALSRLGISYETCPGVSSFCGAAASLDLEYTLPEVSQSVIITRMSGKTSVPETETIEAFASHQSTMVIFLSTSMLDELQMRLINGGYSPDTPAAIVYKASWPDEQRIVGTVRELAAMADRAGIKKTALIIVGKVLGVEYARSRLYDPSFSTEFREAKEDGGNAD